MVSLARITNRAANDNDPATQTVIGGAEKFHHHSTAVLSLISVTSEPVMYRLMLKCRAIALTTDNVETRVITCPFDSLSLAPPACHRITPPSMITSGRM